MAGRFATSDVVLEARVESLDPFATSVDGTLVDVSTSVVEVGDVDEVGGVSEVSIEVTNT